MSYPLLADSKPFLIGGLDDLELAFQFSKATHTNTLLIVRGHHLLFWKHQNFSDLINLVAKKTQYPFFRLIVDAQDKISLVLYAMHCKDVSAIVCKPTLPLGPNLRLLAQEKSIAIVEHSPL